MGVQTWEHIDKEITLLQQRKKQALAANSQKSLPAK